jgi:hypothetical protein
MKVLRVGLSVAADAALLWGAVARGAPLRGAPRQSSTARLRQSAPSEWLAEPRRAGLLIEVDTLSWRP